jgi:hypothetical protein
MHVIVSVTFRWACSLYLFSSINTMIHNSPACLRKKCLVPALDCRCSHSSTCGSSCVLGHMSGNDCTYCPGCLFEVGPTPKKKTIQYCIFCLDKNVDAFVAYYRTIILEHHNILRTVGLLPLVVIRHLSCVFIYICGTMQAVVCDFR